MNHNKSSQQVESIVTQNDNMDLETTREGEENTAPTTTNFGNERGKGEATTTTPDHGRRCIYVHMTFIPFW